MVVDASVVVEALVDDRGLRDAAQHEIGSGDLLIAPDLMRLEVASALRGLLTAGRLSGRDAALAMDRLGAMAVHAVPAGLLMQRVWSLRGNLTPYDASYVAAAEISGAPLVTVDQRLAAAPGIRCEVRLLVA